MYVAVEFSIVPATLFKDQRFPFAVALCGPVDAVADVKNDG